MKEFSIIDYAKGEIDGDELVYELGDSASSVAGGFAGGAAGAKIGAALGTVVASEAYATAVEAGAEGTKILAEKAETFVKDTVELVKESMPEKLDEVKSAFNDYVKSCNLPFSV